jgi:hypothetical protein
VGRLPFMPIVLVPDGLLDISGHGKDIDQLGKMHNNRGMSSTIGIYFRRRFFFGLVFCGKPWLFEEL